MNKSHWQDSNLQPTVHVQSWASNSGEEKDSLDHSGTGYVYIIKEPTEYCTSKHLGVT